MSLPTISRFLSDLRSRLRRDDGASLVLTMVFVMGVGMVVVALLTYAQTGITTAKVTAERHALSSDASGAMDAAINSLRNSILSDSVTSSCDSSIQTTVLGADGQAVRVVCTTKAGTGASAGTVPINVNNRPGSAVLTLGTSPSEVGFAKLSNADLSIKGRVYINSNVTVAGSSGKLTVTNAQLFARTGCTPSSRVISTPAPNCAATGTPAESRDPATLTSLMTPNGDTIRLGYTQPDSTPSDMPHRLVPSACPGSGINTVEFNPGFYDDAAALTALSTSCNKSFHFNPGKYFFDFRNEEVAAMAAGLQPFPPGAIPSGQLDRNVWMINNANLYVVGGTKKNWSSGGIPAAFPDSCVSPLTSTLTNEGVQFIFGGSSRINVRAGKVELCGQYSIDRPALVVYGAKEGTTTVVPSQGLVETATAAPVPAPNFSFTSPNQANAFDGALATAAITRNPSTTKSAGIRLRTTNAASAVPAGSTLVSAELRVTHRETTSIANDAISVSMVANPAGTAVPLALVTVPIRTAVTPTLDIIPVPLTSALSTEVWRNGLADLQLDYNVVAYKSGSIPLLTADLDAAQLFLSWKPPSLRKQTEPTPTTNCVGAVPPAAATCALIDTDGSQTKFYLQGTTYAPLARFQIHLPNQSGQVFKSGIVARALTVSMPSSSSASGPVIEIPDETGAGVNLGVYLSAYVCTNSSGCGATSPPGANWRRIGRSEVSLFSAVPVVSGARQVTVSNWHVLE